MMEVSEVENTSGVKTTKNSDTLVIKADTDIENLRVEENKKLFPLLDYVENSKIDSADNLSYFESLFSNGNMSELSKSMTANMWVKYRAEKCQNGFSFK